MNLNWLFPRITLHSLRFTLGLAVYGAIIAGVYGIFHDQVTFTLSPEYFTRFKFYQFKDANLGIGDRFFAGTIGFLATWWVGFIGGWLLGRASVGKDGTHPPFREVARLFLLVVMIAVLSGLAGYLFGTFTWDKAATNWKWWVDNHGVEDISAFARVGHIHNFGYLGAGVGLVIAIVVVRRKARRA